MKVKRHHREIIALKLIDNLGNRRICELLRCTDNPSDIFSGDIGMLCRIEGISRANAEAISLFDRWDTVDSILAKTESSGAGLISIPDPEYPQHLARIYDPPPLLWVRGDPMLLSAPSVGVVGTRSMDRYGRSQAEQWSRKLIQAGFAVVSGLATGIDTVAHQTVVEEGGKTAAVLGCGIDIHYPRRNGPLAEQIVDRGGLLVSEFLPGTKPFPARFPIRNRVVSGLCLGVLVIQSGVKGGSMITARSAIDQNREVFVVPHNLGRSKGGGNNLLIQSGEGKLVCGIEDILEELPVERCEENERGQSSRPEAANRSGKPSVQLNPLPKWKRVELSDEQRDLCRQLSDGPVQIGRLVGHSSRSVSELLPILLELEMMGVVRQLAGKYFELR